MSLFTLFLLSICTMFLQFKIFSLFILLFGFGQVSWSTELDDNLPNAYQDGPTKDKSAGLGIELECSKLLFQSKTANEQVTFASKGKLLGERKGTNWKLTADTTPAMAGVITAEYILDGTQIKIGAGSATKAIEEVVKDIVCGLHSYSKGV